MSEVWLWDTCGPAGSGHGITDDPDRARQAATIWLRACPGGTGQVEKAHDVLGTSLLSAGYERLGEGWSAELHNGGQVTWTVLPAPLGLAS